MNTLENLTVQWNSLLPPLKIKTFYPLKGLFAKFKLFFASFSTHSVSLIRDHIWDSPKGGLNIGILLYIGNMGVRGVRLFLDHT